MPLSAYDIILHQRNTGNTGFVEKFILGSDIAETKVLGFSSGKAPALVTPIMANVGTQAGDILYFNGSAWVRLAVGSPGQVLKTNSAGSSPVWENLAAGHEQNTDIGTSSGTFYLGGQSTSTVMLKNSTGVLHVRLGNDSDYATVRVKDLIVEGTTTTVNSETMTINDNIITLNSNYSGSTPSESGGIEVKRGTLTNASLIWDEASDKWKCGLSGGEVEIALMGHVHTKSNISDFNHNLLSASHNDVAASPAMRGAIIAGMGASVNWSALPAGTSGQFLKTFGAANDPAWSSVAISDVTNLQATLDGKSSSNHVHNAGDITTGTLPLSRGGTNNSGTFSTGKLIKYDGTSLVSDTNTYPYWVNVPSSPLSAGSPGQMAYDGDYFYVCVASSSWLRTSIASWN